MPASAVSLAAGSGTPRRRSVSAIADASEAILISSRSRSSALAAMIDWRRLLWARRSSLNTTPAASSPAATASIGAAEEGEPATAVTRRSRRLFEPAKRTSFLSAKWRKNVRSVRPARSAISATVVWS